LESFLLSPMHTYIIILIINLSISLQKVDFKNDGIIFYDLTEEQALSLAKSQDKLLLILFHFDGCGICKYMEKTVYNEKIVADFYNESFICIGINTSTKYGRELKQKYAINSQPAHLFFDPHGKLVHKIVGLYNAAEFTIEGEVALNRQGLVYYQNLYLNRKKDPDFLLNFVYKLHNANELDSVVVNEYLNTQSNRQLIEEENIRFIYNFAFYEFRPLVPFHKPAIQYLFHKKEEFYNYFDPQQVDVRILWLSKKYIENAIQTENKQLFEQVLPHTIDFDNGITYLFKNINGKTSGAIKVENDVINYIIAFYERTGDYEFYTETLNDYISQIYYAQKSIHDILYKLLNEFVTEAELMLLKKWAEKSLEQNNTSDDNMLLAKIYFELKDYEKSLEYAISAKNQAVKENKNFQEVEILISKLQNLL